MKVAHIQLNFKQHRLINLLKDRGLKIYEGNKAGTNKVNQLIDKSLFGYPASRKEMCEIISAFVIFNTEDGYEQAKKTIKQGSLNKPELNLKLLGEAIKFKQAP